MGFYSRTVAMAHLAPLPPETTPELSEDFAIFEHILGFIPNSLLTMQRMPGMVKGFGELTKAVMDPGGAVDLGFMRLVAHFASRAAGCQYCEAHSLVAAKIHGIGQDKLDAIWDYSVSPLYNDAERVALDFALAAGAVPNAVDADLMARMKAHWSEQQIVQILGAVCLYGFLNRWNDSMATDLEDAPRTMGERVLARGGWTGGKHL
jgi:alkylhydroperoxidase family enzyme